MSFAMSAPAPTDESGCKCNLEQIKITEHCDNGCQGVDNPHYCQSYRQR